MGFQKRDDGLSECSKSLTCEKDLFLYIINGVRPTTGVINVTEAICDDELVSTPPTAVLSNDGRALCLLAPISDLKLLAMCVLRINRCCKDIRNGKNVPHVQAVPNLHLLTGAVLWARASSCITGQQPTPTNKYSANLLSCCYKANNPYPTSAELTINFLTPFVGILRLRPVRHLVRPDA